MTAWHSAAVSETGQRANNEDAYLEAPDLRLWAIADGMGGHAHGELASRTALQALKSAVLAGHELAPAMAAANRATWEAARKRGSDMGTTLVAVRLQDELCELAWLGDSRLYRWSGGVLAQLSRDHTVVREWVEAGRLSPDQARHHPYGHVLTHAVGLEPGAAPEATTLPLAGGERFLLCSDGLTDTLDDEAIAAVLAAQPDEKAPAALYRAAEAAANPYQDNLTAVLVYPS